MQVTLHLIRQTCSHYVLVHPLKIRFWAWFNTSKPDFTKRTPVMFRKILFNVVSSLDISPPLINPQELRCVCEHSKETWKSALISASAPIKFSQQLETPLQISWFLNSRQQWHSAVTERTLTHLGWQYTRNRICLFPLLLFWFLQHFETNKGTKAVLLK